ncbi:MAG: HlyD family type I secretion periplasmic adaptor subunit [Alphaproteobacteria bacterium]|nr:HlyD family type I secretion periplasmic adaptor subunit [Alphaproteobacteria bacterium]
MRMFDIISRKLKSLFAPVAEEPVDDNVEIVDAESVDPKAPLEQPEDNDGEDEAANSGPFGWLKNWWIGRKRAVYHFFVPQPILVPAQLVTPEVDFDDAQTTKPLKGQMIYISIGVFFIVAVAWASLAQIDEVVRAEAMVVPSENVQVVQSRLPGSVVEITASLGDRVYKGDVLFKIEDEDVIANFADNEIQRLTARAGIIRLEAERAGLENIVFPSELVAAAPEIVAQEKALFEGRLIAKKGERDVLIQESESLRRGIEEREAEAKLAERQLLNIEQEREIIAPLVERGFEPKLALLSIDARIEDVMGRKTLAELAARRMRSDLEAQSRKLTSLDNRYRADAETQLVEMRTLAAQTEARLDALQGKVAYAEVKAPTDGTISAVHVKTVGAVIDAGSVLAEVVPDEEEVTLRAQVMLDDVAKIEVGQRVRVSLSAFDVSRYGALDGVVEQIASNSTQEDNQLPYFVTMVNIPEPVFPNSGFRPEITPGMGAVVDVLGDKRTVLGYILSPIQRAQSIAFREK